eukprot:2681845-Amphidinium_carterae.1
MRCDMLGRPVGPMHWLCPTTTLLVLSGWFVLLLYMSLKKLGHLQNTLIVVRKPLCAPSSSVVCERVTSKFGVARNYILAFCQSAVLRETVTTTGLLDAEHEVHKQASKSMDLAFVSDPRADACSRKSVDAPKG